MVAEVETPEMSVSAKPFGEFLSITVFCAIAVPLGVDTSPSVSSASASPFPFNKDLISGASRKLDLTRLVWSRRMA
jgi:hypothetical protein